MHRFRSEKGSKKPKLEKSKLFIIVKPDLRGGRRECYNSATVTPNICWKNCESCCAQL